MNPNDLVVLRTFLNDATAAIAPGALESAGIETMVLADDAGGMRPSFGWVV
ncbi:MAG: hypothetical protein WB987_03840 [Candidatus Acidiferrales bacterium]